METFVQRQVLDLCPTCSHGRGEPYTIRVGGDPVEPILCRVSCEGDLSLERVPANGFLSTNPTREDNVLATCELPNGLLRRAIVGFLEHDHEGTFTDNVYTNVI